MAWNPGRCLSVECVVFLALFLLLCPAGRLALILLLLLGGCVAHAHKVKAASANDDLAEISSGGDGRAEATGLPSDRRPVVWLDLRNGASLLPFEACVVMVDAAGGPALAGMGRLRAGNGAGIRHHRL